MSKSDKLVVREEAVDILSLRKLNIDSQLIIADVKRRDKIFLHSEKKIEVETCWQINKPSNIYFSRFTFYTYINVYKNNFKSFIQIKSQNITNMENFLHQFFAMI